MRLFRLFVSSPADCENERQALAEVVDRHGADLVVHGHAHHGTLQGKTTGGVPVHNVAITLLQAQNPPAVYRVFDV